MRLEIEISFRNNKKKCIHYAVQATPKCTVVTLDLNHFNLNINTSV